MDLDWPHTAEGWKQHHKTSTKMERKENGKRRRGRPRNTWRRNVESEMKQMNYNRQALEKMALNRVRWREFVNGRAPLWSQGLK